MNSSTYKEKVCWRFALCGCAMALTLPLCADSYTDGSLANITNTTRFVKSGTGTLVLSGDNSLSNGLQVTAGTLKFNGGTTTINCSTSGYDTDKAPSSQSGTGTTVVVEGGANVTVSDHD